jgi:hypothetical protein
MIDANTFHRSPLNSEFYIFRKKLRDSNLKMKFLLNFSNQALIRARHLKKMPFDRELNTERIWAFAKSRTASYYYKVLL